MDINTILGFSILGNSTMQVLLFIGYLFAGILAAKIIYFLLEKVLKPLVEKTKFKFDDYIFDIIDKPVVLFIAIMGFLWATRQLTLGAKGTSIVDGIIFTFIVINIAYLIVKLIDVVLNKYITSITEKTTSDLDDQLLPIINTISVVVVYGFTIVFILSHFGYQVSSLLAGLGIGGLAFALAAKDILSNLFGSVSIIADKPFKIGDRIKLNEFDGIVREIGLRTTRIKTLEGTYVTIPNNLLTTDAVENISLRKGRKTKLTIGVEYDTSSKKLEEGVKILKGILKKHPGVKDKDYYVHFATFGDFSLGIDVIYWIHTSKYVEIINIRHEINSEIKKQFEKAKIDMAFPTQTVYVKK